MKDFILAIVAAGLAVFIYVDSRTFAAPQGGLAKDPALYPQMLALILALLAVALAVNVIRGKRLNEKIVLDRQALFNVGRLVVILCLYVFAIVYVGFPVSTVLFIYVGVVALGGSRLTAAKLCLPVALALYVVFFVLFQMPMPVGKLWEGL